MHAFGPLCTFCSVAIALCVVVADAFTMYPTSRRITTNADNTNFKHDQEYAKRFEPLSMVAPMPTSNVTLDGMMLIDTVFVDDVEGVRYDDENDEEESDDLSTMDTMEIKKRLLNLLPRMMGTQEEYNMVESYVNTLEDRYVPIQTVDFLNLAMSGEWQLLFSTNLGGSPRPNFRLSELFQRIETSDNNGTVVTQATWAWAEDHTAMTLPRSFDTSGTFSIKCSYSIEEGARMIMELNQHVIELAKGTPIPKEPEVLVSMLYKAIPTELFDPNDHAMDTTYLDGDLRIVRMTGPKFEAVRDIFIRRGSVQINPF